MLCRLFLAGTVLLFISCGVMKEHRKGGSLSDLSKVKRAERLYNSREYEKAISLCIAVLNNGGGNMNLARRAKLQLARIYVDTRQFEKSVSLYDEVLHTPGPDILPTDVTNCMDVLKRTGQVDEARKIATLYESELKDDIKFKNLQSSLTGNYQNFNQDSIAKVKIDSLPVNMGGYQYGMSLYRKQVIFLSNELKKGTSSFSANAKSFIITEHGIVPFADGIKGVPQVGPATYYDNGKKVIYTVNPVSMVKIEQNSLFNSKTGTLLQFAAHESGNNSWSKSGGIKLIKNGDSYSFLHPAVTENGQRLYFVSDMAGGYGGTDIYYADWDREAQKWQKPVNMGPAVNTSGNELYPFIHNNKLFFSSSGLSGFGGLDIFLFNTDQPDVAPVHLPYPINTQADDLNPVLDATNWLLYFTSDRTGGHDNDRIYLVDLKKTRLDQLGLSVPQEEIVEPVMDNITDSREEISYTDNAAKENNVASSFSSDTIASVPDIIYFDRNAVVPQDKEWYKIDSIFRIWKMHTNQTIVINGHADIKGREQGELALSKNRAAYIRACLKSRGVYVNRIKINYYGASRPVSKESLPERNVGINRRCEIKILSDRNIF